MDPKKAWRTIKNLRFLQLTFYFCLFLFVFPYLGREWILRLFSSIFLLNALLVTLSASGRTVRWKWLLWLLWGISVLLDYLFLTSGLPDKSLLFLKLAIVSDTFLLLICLTIILIFIFETSKITVDIIFAAVAAYLLIAFTFAQGYLLVHYLVPGSFDYPASVNAAELNAFHSDMIYYSLIIITTAGIGDILPKSYLARSLTALEAVTGQFFVAILVAWLVGRFISQEK